MIIPSSADLVKVLVIDSDKNSIDLITSHLVNSGYDVLQSRDVNKSLQAISDFKPELILCDLRMPLLNDVNILKLITDGYPNLPVIVISTDKDMSDAVEALRLGASDYLVKPIKKLELIAVIESTLSLLNNGNTKYNLVEVEDLKINVDSHEVFIKDDCVEMTPNEFKILYAFMLKIEHVLSREKILEALGKNMSSINDRTIDSHISHLRKKINPSQLKIRSVYGEGYKLTLKKSAA